LFHHGCPDLGPAELTTATGRARLRQAPTAHLTGTARYQVAAALRMIDHLEAELEPLYRQIRQIARRMRGPRVLPRAALWGGAGDRARLDLLVGWVRPRFFLPQRGPVHRSGHEVKERIDGKRGGPLAASRPEASR
jgi:hypothetical protein